MDATQAEKVSQLAKSLYSNRLAGSMDDAYKMAESILSRSAAGEAKSTREIEKESPIDEMYEEQTAPEDKPMIEENIPEHHTQKQAGKTHQTPSKSQEISAHSDASKIEALRHVVSEEEERIAALKKELTDLKEGIGQSGSVVGGIDAEIESLAKDIENAKQDIREIHEHIRDLQDIKREVREAVESQEAEDSMIDQADELKERVEKWTPPRDQ